MIHTDIRHYCPEKVIEEAEQSNARLAVCIASVDGRIFSPTSRPVNANKVHKFIGFCYFMKHHYGAQVVLMTHSPQEGWHIYKEFNKNNG
jgi:hypothetical protein